MDYQQYMTESIYIQTIIWGKSFNSNVANCNRCDTQIVGDCFKWRNTYLCHLCVEIAKNLKRPDNKEFELYVMKELQTNNSYFCPWTIYFKKKNKPSIEISEIR